VDNYTKTKAHWILLPASATQKQKSGCFEDTQQPMKCIETDKVVVNLTNRALNPAAIAILSKGLNYAQTMGLKSNLKDVISGVEQAIQHLSTETAKEIRQETSRILRHSNPPPLPKKKEYFTSRMGCTASPMK
jgi:hypothetical protein